MFAVEYRTISRTGNTYPSQVANVGAHKAQTKDEAAAHILRTTQNAEIISVQYVGSL